MSCASHGRVRLQLRNVTPLLVIVLKKYLVRSLQAIITKLRRTESYNNYSLILSCVYLKCLEYEMSKYHRLCAAVKSLLDVAKMSHMICMPSSGTRVNCGNPFNKYKVRVCHHLKYTESPQVFNSK